MASDTATLTADERRLLERLADRVVELRLEVPAILTLETARPAGAPSESRARP